MSLYLEFSDVTGQASSRGFSLEFLADHRRYDFATDVLSATPATPLSPVAPDARALTEDTVPYLGIYRATLPTLLTASLPDGTYLVRFHSRTTGTVLDEAVVALVGGVDVSGASIGPVVLAANGLDSVIVESNINARQALALIGAERVGNWSYPNPTNIGHVLYTAMGGTVVRVDALLSATGRTTILTPPA